MIPVHLTRYELAALLAALDAMPEHRDHQGALSLQAMDLADARRKLEEAGRARLSAA